LGEYDASRQDRRKFARGELQVKGTNEEITQLSSHAPL
jgi:hypothetical protein